MYEPKFEIVRSGMIIQLTNEEMATIRQELNRELAVAYLECFDENIVNYKELQDDVEFLDELGDFIMGGLDEQFEDIRGRYYEDDRVKWKN